VIFKDLISISELVLLIESEDRYLLQKSVWIRTDIYICGGQMLDQVQHEAYTVLHGTQCYTLHTVHCYKCHTAWTYMVASIKAW